MKSLTIQSVATLLLALLIGVFTMSCNTMKGFGEDVEQVGDNIEEAAEDAAN